MGHQRSKFADFSKPPEKLSDPQQMAVTCTGLIWSRYSTAITPKNWNLFAVNVAMAAIGIYQLSHRYSMIIFRRQKQLLHKNDDENLS